MSDEGKGPESAQPGDGGSKGPEGSRFKRGFRRGVGAFSAFRDALGQTVQEARDRGDFSVDRAKDAMKGAVGRAREASSEARERFDFVPRGDFDALVRKVRDLEARMETGGRPDGDIPES